MEVCYVSPGLVRHCGSPVTGPRAVTQAGHEVAEGALQRIKHGDYPWDAVDGAGAVEVFRQRLHIELQSVMRCVPAYT